MHVCPNTDMIRVGHLVKDCRDKCATCRMSAIQSSNHHFSDKISHFPKDVGVHLLLGLLKDRLGDFLL